MPSPLPTVYLPFPEKMERHLPSLSESGVAFLLFVLILPKSRHLLGRLSIQSLGQTTPSFVGPHNYFFLPHRFQQFSQSLPSKKKMFVSFNLRSLKEKLVRQQNLQGAASASGFAAPSTNIPIRGDSREGSQRLFMWQKQELEVEYPKVFPLMAVHLELLYYIYITHKRRCLILRFCLVGKIMIWLPELRNFSLQPRPPKQYVRAGLL